MIPFKLDMDRVPLDDWGTPEDIGAQSLGPAPRVAGKILFGTLDSPVSGGLYAATRGRYRVTYPFDEHATLLDGQLAPRPTPGHRRPAPGHRGHEEEHEEEISGSEGGRGGWRWRRFAAWAASRMPRSLAGQVRRHGVSKGAAARAGGGTPSSSTCWPRRTWTCMCTRALGER
jgi:hypothetical protein